MKEEFYKAYSDLATFYLPRRDPFWIPSLLSRRAVWLVNDALEEAVKEMNLDDQLRPDARFFLLINLHQMVLLPLSYAKQLPAPELMAEIIRHDVRTVLEIARSRLKQADRHEISGHMIVDALSEVWQKLRVTEFELWG